jgi:hypothetical protein
MPNFVQIHSFLLEIRLAKSRVSSIANPVYNGGKDRPRRRSMGTGPAPWVAELSQFLVPSSRLHDLFQILGLEGDCGAPVPVLLAAIGIYRQQGGSTLRQLKLSIQRRLSDFQSLQFNFVLKGIAGPAGSSENWFLKCFASRAGLRHFRAREPYLHWSHRRGRG